MPFLTGVTDIGFVALGKHRNLNRINLNCCRIADKAIFDFLGSQQLFPQLQHLHLNESIIFDNTITRLREK